MATDETGKRYHSLTVLSKIGRDKQGRAIWLCRCDCGNEIEARGASLREGNTKSCGCAKKASGPLNATIHGEGVRHEQTPEYRTWCAMRSRCNTPSAGNYAGYGGRGIKVCARWDDFLTFLADMGRKPSPAHSIDRVDPNGDYEPGNCRWSTASEQQRNKRRNVRHQHRPVAAREATGSLQ